MNICRAIKMGNTMEKNDELTVIHALYGLGLALAIPCHLHFSNIEIHNITTRPRTVFKLHFKSHENIVSNKTLAGTRSDQGKCYTMK